MNHTEILRAIEDGATGRDLMRAINGGPFFLLGVDVATGHKTYQCSDCGRQRFTLVTRGAKLPESCPKCGAK